jgi:hypothetical protein
MSVALILSAVLAVAIGFAFLCATWPPAVDFHPYRAVVIALASGVGLGITAVGLFGWLVLFGPPDRALMAVELAVLILVVGWINRAKGWRAPVFGTAKTGPPASALVDRIVVMAFVVTLACAAAAFVGLSVSRPHGAWDAWMNWNLRARMIFRAGPEWRVAFSPLIPWSHPDYPMLVQASVVRTWIYAGGETLLGPAMVAFLFTFGTAGLVVAALAALRDRTQGMLAGLVLLATPFLIFHGTSQYGDVPVGFFFLATVVLLALHDRHREDTGVFAILAGLTTGLAGWTKNEGLLFLAAVVLAALLTLPRAEGGRRCAREAGLFLLGLLPMLVLIAYFKLRFAPPNDLMSTFGTGETLARLTDPQRYLAVAKGYGREIATFGFNGLIGAGPLLGAYGVIVGVCAGEVRTRWFRMTVWIVALMLMGHAIVIIATAADVARLVNSSLDRLLLQLWPVIVLACFRVFRSPMRRADPGKESALSAESVAA